jgi:hypothetical protein
VPTIHFNPLVIATFARLSGASAFLEAMNDGIPTVKEHDYLQQLAAQGDWAPGEYFIEKDLLDDKFRTWVPTFAAYSVITLLYSIVETQLYGLAEHVANERGSKLRVKDMAGRGLGQSVLLLEKVLSFRVKTDPAWEYVHDL